MHVFIRHQFKLKSFDLIWASTKNKNKTILNTNYPQVHDLKKMRGFQHQVPVKISPPLFFSQIVSKPCELTIRTFFFSPRLSYIAQPTTSLRQVFHRVKNPKHFKSVYMTYYMYIHVFISTEFDYISYGNLL